MRRNDRGDILLNKWQVAVALIVPGIATWALFPLIGFYNILVGGAIGLAIGIKTYPDWWKGY